MNKDAFLEQLFNNNKFKQYHDITEFGHIIKQTTQKFYRDNNDFSIADGHNNCVYLAMKHDIPIKGCSHVAVKLNLDDGTVKQFSRDHECYILSFVYNSAKNILVTGGWHQSIYLYNCATMKLIKQVVVGQGPIFSLILKSNMLYVGGCRIVSVYSFHNNSDVRRNYGSAESDMSLVRHIQVAPQTCEEVYFTTLTECGQFDFWLGGYNSNKIYRVSVDQQSTPNVFPQLNNNNSTPIETLQGGV
jgi:hypothetical protein